MKTEKQNAQHALPLGAVVIYKDETKTAKLVVVQHSRDCDQTPLYMVGEKPIAPPDDKYKLYSMGYLTYRLHVGCFAGNVPLSMLTDTGERVPLERFDVERYDSWPNNCVTGATTAGRNVP